MRIGRSHPRLALMATVLITIGSGAALAVAAHPAGVITIGGPGNDSLTGTDGPDYLGGREGNDTIDGKQGDDVLFGVQGQDKLYGREGADVLYGTFHADTLVGGPGDDYLSGGPDPDRIYAAGDGADLVVINHKCSGGGTSCPRDRCQLGPESEDQAIVARPNQNDFALQQNVPFEDRCRYLPAPSAVPASTETTLQRDITHSTDTVRLFGDTAPDPPDLQRVVDLVVQHRGPNGNWGQVQHKCVGFGETVGHGFSWKFTLIERPNYRAAARYGFEPCDGGFSDYPQSASAWNYFAIK